LAERIIDGSNDTSIAMINLKVCSRTSKVAKQTLQGLGIGNGLVSEALNVQTTIEFAYYHGMVDEE
jgi:hypothetical protein